MSIVINISNSSPDTYFEGLAVKQQGESATVLTVPTEKEICLCLVECETSYNTFWHDDNSERKNDKTSFLFAKQRSSDTVLIELYKNDRLIDTITDDTLGEFYDGFPSQPLYYGFILDWNKVYSVHGNGRYYIKVSLDILGTTREIETQKFNLTKFSDEIADGTIKLEAWQTGNILGDEIDYTDLITDGWYTSYRIAGFFGKKTPILEQDNFVNTNYEIEQIQDKLISEYTLETRYIDAITANEIFFKDVLANRIIISDYNILNAEVFDKIDVVPVSVDDVTYKERGTRVKHTWKFKHRVEDNIKTNF